MIPASLQSHWGDRMLTHETFSDTRQRINGRKKESTKQLVAKLSVQKRKRLLHVVPKKYSELMFLLQEPMKVVRAEWPMEVRGFN